MSDTPRTDAVALLTYGVVAVPVEFARQLEQELREKSEELAMLNRRIMEAINKNAAPQERNREGSGNPTFASPAAAARYGVFSEELQCFWISWAAISPRALELRLEDCSCTDMSGAIEVATRLLPGVRLIQTYGGRKPDTRYELVSGEWQAFSPTLSKNP
jgi:PAS domain-containing protein